MGFDYSKADDSQWIKLAAAILEQALEDARLLGELARRRAWRKTSRQQAMRAASWFVGVHAELTSFVMSGRYGSLMEGMSVNEFHFRRALQRELDACADCIADAKEVLRWANRQARKPRTKKPRHGLNTEGARI